MTVDAQSQQVKLEVIAGEGMTRDQMLKELSQGKELPAAFTDLSDEEVFAVYNMHHRAIKGTSNP